VDDAAVVVPDVTGHVPAFLTLSPRPSVPSRIVTTAAAAISLHMRERRPSRRHPQRNGRLRGPPPETQKAPKGLAECLKWEQNSRRIATAIRSIPQHPHRAGSTSLVDVKTQRKESTGDGRHLPHGESRRKHPRGGQPAGRAWSIPPELGASRARGTKPDSGQRSQEHIQEMRPGARRAAGKAGSDAKEVSRTGRPRLSAVSMRSRRATTVGSPPAREPAGPPPAASTGGTGSRSQIGHRRMSASPRSSPCSAGILYLSGWESTSHGG